MRRFKSWKLTQQSQQWNLYSFSVFCLALDVLTLDVPDTKNCTNVRLSVLLILNTITDLEQCQGCMFFLIHHQLSHSFPKMLCYSSNSPGWQRGVRSCCSLSVRVESKSKSLLLVSWRLPACFQNGLLFSCWVRLCHKLCRNVKIGIEFWRLLLSSIVPAN